MYITDVSSEEDFYFMEQELSDALQPPNPKQAKRKQAGSPNVMPPRKKVQSSSITIVRPDKIFVYCVLLTCVRLRSFLDMNY